MNVNIGEKIWQNRTQSLIPEYVRVIGRVIGKVFIKDLNKMISYNTVADIYSDDARKSKDLINAIQNKWVDIVYGKEFLNQKTYTTQRDLSESNVETKHQLQPQMNIDELKKYVSDETQKAVSALGVSVAQILDEVKKLQNKDNSNVVLNQDLANEIVQQIVNKLPSGKVSEKDVEKITENIFINVDDGKELKTNIKTGELGEVTKLKDKKAKSIASKLKKIGR